MKKKKKRKILRKRARLLATLLSLCIAMAAVTMTALADTQAEGNVIKHVEVIDATLSYQAGDAPKATATVSDSTAHYEIAYENWMRMEQKEDGSWESVEAWYSDPDTLSVFQDDEKITSFEMGKYYIYNIELNAKDGYTFSFESDLKMSLNGKEIPSGSCFAEDNGSKLHVAWAAELGSKWPVTDDVYINDVIFDYTPGDVPKATACKLDPEAGYDIEYEYWEEMETKSDGTSEPVAFWYSDENKNNALSADKKITAFEEGKTYMYSISLKANDLCSFSDNCSVTVNNVKVDARNVLNSKTSLFVVAVKTIKPKKPVPIKPIELIQINGATVKFNAGDKPIFTGTVSGTDPYYYIDHEGWIAPDGGITSSDYWNRRYGDFEGSWGKLVTSFDADTKYVYNVYLKLSGKGYDEGYRFDEKTKLCVNGQTINLNIDSISLDPDGETIWFYDVLTMTPTVNDTCVNGHQAQKNVTKATAKNDGKIVTSCSVCKKILSTEILSKASDIRLSAISYTYNGKARKPSVTVNDRTGKKISTTNYTVSYAKGRKNVGSYEVTVTFKGNYQGKVTKSFTIKPQGISIGKVTAGKKRITVKWRKQTKQISGYEIQYSTDKKFIKDARVTVSARKTTSKTIKKLKTKKKYYLRIRSYKTVKVKGKNTKIYSSWSKVKSAKVK